MTSRRLLGLAVSLGLAFTYCGAAWAQTEQVASAGGVTATLTYKDGPGPETIDERLTIRGPGTGLFATSIPAKGCFKVCSPAGSHAVHVVDLSGDGHQSVVLDLFTGGADCCTQELVYSMSAAAPGDWVGVAFNLGEDGAKLEDIGPRGRALFVSGNKAFYCRFSACYASGLPIQIFELEGGGLVDVTRHYPKLIAADGSRWIKLYYHDPSEGHGAIAAWAADDDQLGAAYQGTVRTVLELQFADHHLTLGFVTGLERFLEAHHYT